GLRMDLIEDDGGSGAEAVTARPKKARRDQPATEGDPPRYGKVARRGVAWSFVREGVTELVTLPSALIMARLLTPFDFGLAASTAFFITLATRLTNIGFNLALVRMKHLRPEHSSSVFVVILALGVVAYTILANTGSLMAAFFRAPQLAEVMPVAALCFLITPFGSVPAAMMAREMRFRHTALCDWIGTLAQASAGIGLALAGYGFWSLVYGQLAGDIAGTVAKLALGRWRPSLRFSGAAVKELLSFGTGVFAKRLLDYGANNLDNLVVGRMLGMSALGFYDKGFMTVRRVMTRLNTGGPMVSFRVLSLIYEEPERFRNAYRRVILASSLLSYPALLGLAALGPDLIPVAYGPRWESTIVPFQILCIAGTFKIITEYAGSAVQAMGKIWGQVGRQVVYAGLIVGFVISFSRWGLPGVAFGVLLATFVMYLLMQGLLMQLTSITAWNIVESQLPGVLCGILVGLAVLTARWLTVGHASWAQWERLVIEMAAGGLTYISFIKFNRFRAVRRLVRDAANDLAPPIGRVVRLLA
ncbi:MAG TPA: lipopolysaccharide biosynthesis protein, partial [Vicinamibacterales bacterium]|nr:lipopolysaccharide biosynthesis protein [Vicinamibacterales bacterium]